MLATTCNRPIGIGPQVRQGECGRALKREFPTMGGSSKPPKWGLSSVGNNLTALHIPFPKLNPSKAQIIQGSMCHVPCSFPSDFFPSSKPYITPYACSSQNSIHNSYSVILSSVERFQLLGRSRGLVSRLRIGMPGITIRRDYRTNMV